MKQYQVKALSIHAEHGRNYYQGNIIDGTLLTQEQTNNLLDQKAIEEYVAPVGTEEKDPLDNPDAE